jgi:hypothetical protein
VEPPTPSPDPKTTTRRYVTGRAEPADGYGRYLELLHGNFTALPDERRGPFLRSMRDDARQVSDAELECMLQPGRMVDWRTRLTAAWLIGFDRRTRFRAMLGGLLLASELVYAGQGYRNAGQCSALQGGVKARGLLHLDYQLGTTEAARFLGPDGLWSRSAFARQDPVSRADRMALLCDIAEWIMTTD